MDQPKLERLLRLMKLLTANTTYNVDQLAERPVSYTHLRAHET